MTEVFDGQNVPQEQAEEQAEEKLRSKLVYVDGPAIEAYMKETKNKTMPAGVHPHLYAAAATYTYETLHDSDGNDFRDSEAGRICVKPGGLTELVRQSVAKLIGYTGELTLASTRITNAEKVQADALRGTASTVFLFARMQAMGDADAEAQSKRTAFAIILKKKEREAPNMVLTEEDLEAMWAESTI